MQSTFTVLVTVDHEPAAEHSHNRIAEAIQTALKEGTVNTAPFSAAEVDVFEGRHVATHSMTVEQIKKFNAFRALHNYPKL